MKKKAGNCFSILSIVTQKARMRRQVRKGSEVIDHRINYSHVYVQLNGHLAFNS